MMTMYRNSLAKSGKMSTMPMFML